MVGSISMWLKRDSMKYVAKPQLVFEVPWKWVRLRRKLFFSTISNQRTSQFSTHRHTKYLITLAWQTIIVYESFSCLALARWKYLRKPASIRAPSMKNCYMSPGDKKKNRKRCTFLSSKKHEHKTKQTIKIEYLLLTCGSGCQWPIGGCGAIGAPSSINEQFSIGTFAICVDMILPVSCARVIVDRIILSNGSCKARSRSPVNAACFRPNSVK